MEQISKCSLFRIVEKIFLIAIIGIILLIIVSVFSDFDIRGVESNVIYSIQLSLKDNSLLYQSPEKPQFNITQYSPLYYVVNDILIGLLPIEITEAFKIRIVARLISIITLSFAFIYLKIILHRILNIDKRTSTIICLLFVIVSFPWYNISRPDVLVLLFFVLSIYSILSYNTNNYNPKNAVLLGVFLSLGLLSKLTMAVFFVSFGLYMLITRNWRLMLISSASFIITSVVLYCLLLLLNYDLTYLYENIVSGVHNGYNINDALKNTYIYFVNYYGVFFIVVILICINTLRVWKNIKHDTTFIFLTTITITSFALAFLSALKIGSAINYFNETLLCMIILVVYILEKYYLNYRKIYLSCIMIFGIGIALNHAFLYLPIFKEEFYILKQNEKDISAIKEELDIHLKSYYLFSDSRRIAMLYPNSSILFPTDIHDLTFRLKVFNYSLLEKLIKNNELKYLIVYPDRKVLYGIDINQKYTLIKKYTNYHLYELTSFIKE